QETKPYRRPRVFRTCAYARSAGLGTAYNFTNIPSPQAEGELWAREAQRRGIKRVALLTQDYPGINNHVKALKIEVGRLGLTVADEQRFDGSCVAHNPDQAGAGASFGFIH